jgi:hypothetical protein
MKKLISEYGDFVMGIVAVMLAIPLFRWLLTGGPLYEFILKFAG